VTEFTELAGLPLFSSNRLQFVWLGGMQMDIGQDPGFHQKWSVPLF
jgi:hypothetical protein